MNNATEEDFLDIFGPDKNDLERGDDVPMQSEDEEIKNIFENPPVLQKEEEIKNFMSKHRTTFNKLKDGEIETIIKYVKLENELKELKQSLKTQHPKYQKGKENTYTNMGRSFTHGTGSKKSSKATKSTQSKAKKGGVALTYMRGGKRYKKTEKMLLRQLNKKN